MKRLLLLVAGIISVVQISQAQCNEPVVSSPQSFCGGGSSILLEALGTDISSTYTINMFDSFGDGWNGYEITLNVGSTIFGPFTVNNPPGDFESQNFTVNEGDLITATWTTGAFASEISFNITDNNGAILFNGVVDDAINYNVPSIGPYSLTWYDAPGGVVLGTGSPLEAVGTSVMPTASTGSYNFYVTQTGTGCTESAAVEIVINITDVNVDIAVVNETCLGTSDGSFSVSNVSCGTAPFSYSVDGGVFGPAPTDLTAGTYTVVVEDNASLQSGSITVVIETTNSVIPESPSTSDSVLSACGGSSSILLNADASPSGAPASFTINMFDSFGDGWNGNAISIYADGVPVLTNATIAPTGSDASATFNAPEGSILTATWVQGSWTTEVSFDVLDGTGATIFSGLFGGTIDYTIPGTVFNTLNWYDTPGGILLGTGSPFEAVGSGIMPVASTGSYTFWVTQINAGCESAAFPITVNVTDLNVTLLTQDESCTDYANGTFTIETVDCGTAPFTFSVDGGAFESAPFLTAGTYTVVVQDDAQLQGSPITITINTTETVIPFGPIVNTTDVYACVGAASVSLEAVGEVTGVDSLLTTMVNDNGAQANMFAISAIQETTLSDFSINVMPGSVNVDIYYRTDNYLDVAGANTDGTDWNFVGSASGIASSGAGIPTNVPIPLNLTIPLGETYSFHIVVTGAQLNYSNGTGLGNVYASNASIEFLEGHGGSGLFNCTYQPRVWNGWIRYEAAESMDVSWFDLATGGQVVGNGSPIEAIGTTVLPDASLAGDYSFFVATNNNGCYSIETEEVVVHVSNVNVTMASVDATCNTGIDGSFVIDDVACGINPFSFSVDGSTPGPAPTDLSPGTYEVIVVDGNLDSSGVYTVTVGSAAGPSDLVINTFSDVLVDVSWNGNGSESGYIVEYGAPGFVPGTGAEIGTVSVSDTFVIVSGLEGNTDYDFYVSADCGTTPGEWGTISFTTDCSAYPLPFNETFEDDSDTRICWYNIIESGVDEWTYQAGSTGGNVLTAFEGDLNARYISSFGTQTAKLASPRINTSGQDSVALIFAYAQQEWFGDQNTTKVLLRDDASSPWVEIASYTSNTDQWTLDTLYISDTSEQIEIAFEGTNNYGYANVVDAVEVLPCSLEPGIDGSENVCRAVDTIDLNDYITAGEYFGSWSFPANESFVNGSIASVQFLPEGIHDFLYVVSTPCASDTTIASIVIYGPSSAGNDGADTICMNEPYNLLSSLSGTIDLGGQWINPTGQNLSGPSISGIAIPGSYNYQYLASNGICATDTSTVLLFVNPDCDYLGLMESDLASFDIYPNPTRGEFTIQATDAEGFFSVEITDLNGRTVRTLKNYISGNELKSIDLSSSENGMYFVKIYNNNVFNTFRLVKD
jgi:hypothetical protein